MTFRLALRLIAVFGLVVSPLAPARDALGQDAAKPAVALPQQARAPEKFALLIGIGKYSDAKIRPLASPVNDVDAMRQVLVEKFAFPGANILTLKNEAATRAQIIEAFKTHVIENAKKNPNAVVVVMYSGHGRRVKDASGDEGDGFDEAIMPADTDNDGSAGRDIIDDEIDALFKELTSYTSNSTFIIDAAHSGGIGSRTPGVVFAASRSEEATFETRYRTDEGGETFHGVFTNALLRALLKAGPETRYRELFNEVSATVSKSFSWQHPMLFGDLHRRVFGGTASGEVEDPFIEVSVKASQGNKVTLGAGTAQGLRDGTIVALYRAEARRLVGEEQKIANAVVTEVNALSAVAELPKGVSVTSRAKAVVVDAGAASRLRVALDKMGTDAEALALSKKIETSLKDNSRFEVVPGCRTRASGLGGASSRQAALCDVSVARGKFGNVFGGAGEGQKASAETPAADEQVHYLATPDDRPLFGLYVRAGEADGAERLVAALENMVRQSSLRSIFNALSPLNGRVRLSLVRVVTAGRDADGRPVVREEKRSEDQLGAARVNVGDRFRVEVENLADVDLYVTILSLGTSGSVAVIYPPAIQSERLPAGASIKTPVYIAGGPVGLETLKLIATTVPADFSFLQQRGLVRGANREQSPLESLLGASTDRREIAEGLRLDTWTTASLDFDIVESGNTSVLTTDADRRAKEQEVARLLQHAREMMAGRQYESATYAADEAVVKAASLGRSHLLLAEARRTLGQIYLAFDEDEKAEENLTKANEIERQVLGPDHPDTAQTLHSLGLLYAKRASFTKDTADFAQAEESFTRELAVTEKAYGPEHTQTVRVLGNLAALYAGRGEYNRAEMLYTRALTSNARTLGPDHPDVADMHASLAALYAETGDYERAVKAYEKALSINEKVFGKNSQKMAALLSGLGGVYLALGEHERAVDYFQQSLAVSRQTKDHVAELRTMLKLGDAYDALRQPEKASDFYRFALLLARETADRRAEAQALTRLGATRSRLNRTAEALDYYAKALKIFNALGDKAVESEVLVRLAESHKQSGDLPIAEMEYQFAIKALKQLYGPEDLRVVPAIIGLATFYREIGKSDIAEQQLEDAQKLVEKALGPDHPEVADLLAEHARAEETDGDIKDAIVQWGQASDIREKNLSSIVAAGTEREKRLYMAALERETNAVVAFHARNYASNPDSARLALTTVLRRKGRDLDVISESAERVASHLGAADRILYKQIVAYREQLGTLTLKGPARGEAAQWASTASALRGDIQRLEASIAARNPEFALGVQPVTLEAVQQALPERAALVELVRYQPESVKVKGVETPQAARYGAFVLRRTGAPTWFDLGEAEGLDLKIAELRKALSSPHADTRPAGRALYEKLSAPLRHALADASPLVVAPDGALNLLPFAALVDEGGDYLAKRHLITYLTAGRDLLRLSLPTAPRSSPLVVAAPDYERAEPAAAAALTSNAAVGKPVSAGAYGAVSRDEADRRSVDLPARFSPLPGTLEGATAIAKSLPAARLITGAQATEGAIKRERGPLVLHVATSAFYLPDQGARSTRVYGAYAEAVEGEVPLTPENPMLRSALVLAGANQRQGGAVGDDGLLTALEASRLDLAGTQLVTLSACETGVGDVRAGHGVYGMRRALTLAGAESQLTSLWRLDDRATARLMAEYYRRLVPGEGGGKPQGRGEALRQAQLALMKEYSHPFYWAAFILSGDWTPLDMAAPNAKDAELKK